MRLLRLLVVATLSLTPAGPGDAAMRPLEMPGVVLWAWERPEDLRFIDTQRVGVAWLDRTIVLTGSAVEVRLRRQPLRLAPGARVMSVVRLEADTAAGAEADPARIAALVAAAARPGVLGLQVDFDALTSHRELYRRILHDTRQRLAPSVPLSITALASWCDGDRWLDELPIDEAVPMLFEMGADDRAIRSRLRDGEPFGASACHGAIGVSTREPLRRLPAFQRAYVFSYRPWTRDAVAAAIAGVTP